MDCVHVIPDFLSFEVINKIRPLLTRASEIFIEQNQNLGNRVLGLPQGMENKELYEILTRETSQDKFIISKYSDNKNFVTEPERQLVFAWLSGSLSPPHVDSMLFPYKSRPLKFASICYLNEDFDGGELVLENIGLTIKPRAGMFVFYPVSEKYRHRVNKITNGVRYSLSKFWVLKDE